MPRIHHAQIAAAAGVSRPTVSRALQNHPSLPLATRRRIQALASQMGYRPNPLVSALMSARNQTHSLNCSTTLAVVTAWHPESNLAPSPTDRRYLNGVKQRAEELGFKFEEFWLDEPGLSAGRLEQILVSRGIVAVLMAPIPPKHPKIELRWEHFSLAAFAPSPQIPVLHQASPFHFRSCYLAVSELVKLGYRRPALAYNAELTSHVRDQWIGGHYAAVIKLPARDRIPPFIAKESSMEAIIPWSAKHQPDVILSNDPNVPTLLRAAKLDKDIAFANLDRLVDQVETAGIDQMHELIGCAAVDIIVGQLNGNQRGVPDHPRDVMIEGHWINGPSAPSRGFHRAEAPKGISVSKRS